MAKVETMVDEKKVLERKNRELQVKAAMSEIENSVKPVANVNGVDFIAEKFDNITRRPPAPDRRQNPQQVPERDDAPRWRGFGGQRSADGYGVRQHRQARRKRWSPAQGRGIELGGKGGGRPTLAQGGAPSADKLEKAFAAAPKIFEELMTKGK